MKDSTQKLYMCKLCSKTFEGSNAGKLKRHIAKDHSLVWEEYLREYHPELGGYCLECGKETKLNSFERGFSEYCSIKCSLNSKSQEFWNERNEKLKKTNLIRYGCENPSQAQEIKDKKVKTCLEHFGVENPYQADDVKNKIKQTNIEKYGAENPFQSDICKEKIKQTNLERYGVEHPGQSEKIKLKAKLTNLEKYGVENPAQSNDIKEKIKQTNLERYGTTSILADKNSREVWKKEREERCGYQYNSQTKEFKESMRKTWNKKTFEILSQKLKLFKNIELLDTKEEYINNEIHRYSCKDHGEFESTGTSVQSVICPTCSKEPRSNLEKEVVDFLSKYVSCETSNRIILRPLEIDIWIPSKNLAVEFDGLYWHSNVHKEKNSHLLKTERCELQNIQLIHVFENEWLNKRPIIESILLAKLGIFQKRLYARKCSVKVVSNELYQEFVELNHLQGYVRASLVLGLFHEDKLVEICSFGKSRFKKDEIELLRHCSKLHYQIVGGFSKLISQWKKLNPEEPLYTYCDRRYSTGKSYEASGWEHIGTSAPNYFYFKGGTLESRIKYQKHKLSSILETFDESLTEQENMMNNGYKWIYDCGNLKFKI